jgi:hypothetical protein
LQCNFRFRSFQKLNQNELNFYANLFSTEGWDKNVAEELVTHMDRKLTCDESEDLAKDLTINEIKKIMSN